MKTGFDNEKYLRIQSEQIKKRIAQSGDGTRTRKTMYIGASARAKELLALFRGVGREDK